MVRCSTLMDGRTVATPIYGRPPLPVFSLIYRLVFNYSGSHTTIRRKQVCSPLAADFFWNRRAASRSGRRLGVFGVERVLRSITSSAKPPDCEDLRTPQHLPCAHRHLPFFALCGSKLTAYFPSQPVRPSAILLTKGDLQTLFQLRVVLFGLISPCCLRKAASRPGLPHAVQDASRIRLY